MSKYTYMFRSGIVYSTLQKLKTQALRPAPIPYQARITLLDDVRPLYVLYIIIITTLI